MKNALRLSALILVALLSGVLSAQAKGSSMYIQVKKATVKATPSVAGKVIGSLEEGTKITVIAVKGNYVNFKNPVDGKTGWVDKPALSSKVVVKKGVSAGTSGFSGDEEAQAAKAFTPEVEAEYRKQTKLDYTWVDNMENQNKNHPEMVPSLDALSAFIMAGGLKVEE